MSSSFLLTFRSKLFTTLDELEKLFPANGHIYGANVTEYQCSRLIYCICIFHEIVRTINEHKATNYGKAIIWNKHRQSDIE